MLPASVLAETSAPQALHDCLLERARLQTILDTLPDGVILADATRGGSIVMVNAATVRLWGAPPIMLASGSSGPDGAMTPPLLARPEGVRFSWSDGTPLALDELPLERALRGERVLGEEIVVEQPTGTRVPVIASGVPLYARDGTVTGAVASFEDITPLKVAERAKREFLSLVTHELRTPLTGIKGIVSGLLADDVSLDPAERRELLALVDEAADHLAGLVTNLLDMSRLEAGALDLAPEACHAADLAAAAVRDAATVLCHHQVEIDTPVDLPEVWADFTQAKRVLVNLLSNAAKYSPERTRIAVQAAREDVPESLVLSVRDEGPGIGTGDLPHVFDRFYRGTSRATQAAGSGLGLAIARGLVLAMGGRIWVDSRPGEGATFFFTLPIAPPAAPIAPTEPRPIARRGAAHTDGTDARRAGRTDTCGAGHGSGGRA